MNRRNRRHFPIVVVLTLISAAVVYVLISGQFTGFGLVKPPEAASAEAGTIDALIQGHFVLIAFLFSVIVVPSLYTVVVFRREPGDDTDARHIHGNTTLEVVWTIIPILLVIGFGIWGVIAYNDVIAEKDNERTVRVQGFKWDWSFTYPDLDDQANPSLVVELNRPVKLDMESNDVIHSFWVPEFRVKQDVVPGGVTTVRFTPTREGVYRIRCAEICGTNHYAMLANVVVLGSQDYQAWLDGGLQLPSDPNQANAEFARQSDPNYPYYGDELSEFCVDTFGDADCMP